MVKFGVELKFSYPSMGDGNRFYCFYNGLSGTHFVLIKLPLEYIDNISLYSYPLCSNIHKNQFLFLEWNVFNFCEQIWQARFNAFFYKGTIVQHIFCVEKKNCYVKYKRSENMFEFVNRERALWTQTKQHDICKTTKMTLKPLLYKTYRR